ncbi:MAG: peroxidase-related enzyme [Myxococcales bacterium]|nr:peroxidase-related enzyme [Myxococcales bacterium]
MTHHGRSLRPLLRDDELVEAIAADPPSAPASPRLRAMIGYAVKLTRSPAAMREADVDALRLAGLDDRAVLDLAMVVAYFNFVNRLAHGLGVELEAEAEHDG